MPCVKRSNGKWSDSPSQAGKYNTKAACEAATNPAPKPRKSIYGLKSEIKKKVFSN